MHYVIGDTHGRYDLVQKMIDSGFFDPSKDSVFFLGDYYKHGKPQLGDNQRLMYLLGKYYCTDISRPGFHLIRGNGEWKSGRMNKVFGNIIISACPDIVALKISGYTVCLSHCGMERHLWEQIGSIGKYPAEFFLNTAQNSDIYKAVVDERRQNGDISYLDRPDGTAPDYWPDNIDKTIFIHGHFPAQKDKEYSGNKLYNYIPVPEINSTDSGPFVRYNELRHAMNIDTGAGQNTCPRLACVCVESFIDRLNDKKANCFYYCD